MPRTRATTAAPPKPLRVTVPQAAAMLSLHPQTVYQLVARELFTVIASGGRGRGKRIFLMPDEVEEYGLRGETALRELRVRTRRLKVGRWGVA